MTDNANTPDYTAPEIVDNGSMFGQSDIFRVMEIAGDSAVTSRLEVFMSSEWVAVYVCGRLVKSFDLFYAGGGADDPYAAAIRFAAELHVLEVMSLSQDITGIVGMPCNLCDDGAPDRFIVRTFTADMGDLAKAYKLSCGHIIT